MNVDIQLTAVPAAGKPGKFLVIARNGEEQLHRDNLDLNSATSRKRFVGATMQAAFDGLPADDWPDDVWRKLEKQLSALAAAPPGDPEPPPTAPAEDDPRLAALEAMPAEVRAEAEAMLADPELAKRIVKDLVKVGVVGEPTLKFLLYLCGASTQLPRPLAVIVRGSSSSGKSYVVNCVAELFPPEVVLHATDITTNALYYFPPRTLRHRWIVAGERSRLEDDDRAEAKRALREMIEAQKISKAVTVKNPDGSYGTRLIEQEGPIAYVETTTLGRIFEEDRNRCLVAATDERKEQTKAILNATAARAAGVDRPDLDHVRLVHHAAIRMIPRRDVAIPFASTLAALFPSDRTDARRSFRHLLQLVKAVALLHFKQRDRDPHGLIVADMQDYQLAAKLAAGPLAVARGGVGESARRFLAALRDRFGEHESFDWKQAREVDAGEPGRSTVNNWLNELDESGVIEQTEPSKGNIPARWKLTGKELSEPTGGLPSVDAVIQREDDRTRGGSTEP